MARIIVDNRAYDVDPENNLLAACLSQGLDIPYFCWHPALGAVGACRMCAVKKYADEKDTRGKIVMSCQEPVVEGMRISIADRDVEKFRAAVAEWLMVNHPHDCPVCDEGGECHLQDMTVMSGHTLRRYRYKKRTFRNQNLGPFVNHEMNRCIHCFRCVRFYRDYAGGRDLADFSAHDRVYFGRHEAGTLENEFSGNLVEVCPTGVFTDKTLKRHFARKWDLASAPSVCVHCSLGCNTAPGERYGGLRCVRNRYNGAVNGYFLCDRGRYGYEFVHSPKRILASRIGGQAAGAERILSRPDALLHLSEIADKCYRRIGIGSPHASLEANFALRDLVGPEHFYAGVSEVEWNLTLLALEILRTGPAPAASLQDAAHADAVLVLGEDVTNTAPMLALALRQAVRQVPIKAAAAAKIPHWHDLAVREYVQDAKGPLFVASPYRDKLSDIATEIRLPPREIASLAFAVAGLLNGTRAQDGDSSPESDDLPRTIAKSLLGAERPLVVAGTHLGDAALLRAAAAISWALCEKGRKASLCLTFPECNSLGLAIMGARSLTDAFEKAAEGNAETVIILENDLYRRAEKQAVDGFFEKCRNIIVLDHLENSTTSRATLVLAAGVFSESDGTIVNNEGRAQRFFKVHSPPPAVQDSWKWLGEMALAFGQKDAENLKTLDDIIQAMAVSIPALGGVRDAAPDATSRIYGQKIPRQSVRASGRTAAGLDAFVREIKPADDLDSPLSFSMEGYRGIPPSPLIFRYWSPGWNSVQALNKFQTEAGRSLVGGDPGKRLIEPAKRPPRSYEHNPPQPPELRADEVLAVPIYHIFGSEEMSILSPSVAERIPAPYIMFHPKDALRLKIHERQDIEIELGGEKRILPARVADAIAEGVAGIPYGLPGLEGFTLPATIKIKEPGE